MIWFNGERVKDVTEHDGLKRSAETLAGFMDKQTDPEYQDKVTFELNNAPLTPGFT